MVSREGWVSSLCRCLCLYCFLVSSSATTTRNTRFDSHEARCRPNTAGGLDNYITKSPISHLRESDLAQALRYRILKAQAEARGEEFVWREDFRGEAEETLAWRTKQLRKRTKQKADDNSGVAESN